MRLFETLPRTIIVGKTSYSHILYENLLSSFFVRFNCQITSWVYCTRSLIYRLKKNYVAAICTGIGVYMWTIYYIKDNITNLYGTNKVAKPMKQPAKFTKQIYDTIYNHSLAIRLCIIWRIVQKYYDFKISIQKLVFRRLMNYCSDIAQPIFTVVFTWACITICEAMLLMNTQIVK